MYSDKMKLSRPAPALRQPKRAQVEVAPKISPQNVRASTQAFMILTLRNDTKLVVTSDAYHGLLIEGDVYRCVFCDMVMDFDGICKESHKDCTSHIAAMKSVPYTGDYAEHLIRELSKDNYYCGICNVIVTAPFLKRHIDTEAHIGEVEKAKTRVAAYSPL